MDLKRTSGGVVVEAPGGALALRQIIGIGRNYAEHAKEMGAALPERPLVFSKNISALSLDGEAIKMPACCRDEATGGAGGGQVDFEAELAVIVGRDAKDVSEGEALSYVLGYAAANDVSARWWQKQGAGGQFFRGKSFDTFCPIGPRVVPASEIGDPQSFAVRCRVNGETLQDGTTGDMIFPVSRLVAELSRGTTLAAGTVLLTGTPSGVGHGRTPPVYLRAGDTVEVEIEGIGTLTNLVEDA